MTKPLGIVFEEIEIGDGVFVQDLVEGGLADVQGKIQPGDVLVGVTAIKVVGGKIYIRIVVMIKLQLQRPCLLL
ncbi:MAG: C-terminal processing protease CtpA/Prc [Bacillariaceae sp.]|jgi:C-terminal processing protease CtpA/Prc